MRGKVMIKKKNIDNFLIYSEAIDGALKRRPR